MQLTFTWLHFVSYLAFIILLQLASHGRCQLRLIEPGATSATINKGLTNSSPVPMSITTTSADNSEPEPEPNPTQTSGITVDSNVITVSDMTGTEMPPIGRSALNGSQNNDIYGHPIARKLFHLPPNYNKEMRPSKFDEPVVVEFEIHVQAINPIKAADMDFRMEVFIAFRWIDLRLNFSNDEFYDGDHILLPTELIDSIWHPNPYILNAKSTEIGQFTGKLIKVYIYRNHTVVYGVNLFVTVACAMQFQYYPFDYQLCPMIIESFSYDESKVKYVWSKQKKFTVNPRLRLLQFVVTYPLVAEECSVERIKEDHNVSQLIAFFRFDRLLGNHLIQTFSPCSLVTALSWLSFWFELDAIPARVSLLITSLLILVTQFSGLKIDMPPVAYVKAVDIWMAGCMIFVFSALAEFVLVKIVYSKTEDLKHTITTPLANGQLPGDKGGDSEESESTSPSSTSSSPIATASVHSSNCTPLVTPSANSPIMNRGQVTQRVMSKESIGGSTSSFDFNTSQQQQRHNNQVFTRTISHNPRPSITLIKTLAMHNPKLGSSMNSHSDGMHTPRRVHAILSMKMPFCWGHLAVPLVWTNEKTKKTHLLWKELDRVSRWFFPFTFCLFLVVYWVVLYVHSRLYAPPSHYGTC